MVVSRNLVDLSFKSVLFSTVVVVGVHSALVAPARAEDPTPVQLRDALISKGGAVVRLKQQGYLKSIETGQEKSFERGSLFFVSKVVWNKPRLEETKISSQMAYSAIGGSVDFRIRPVGSEEPLTSEGTADGFVPSEKESFKITCLQKSAAVPESTVDDHLKNWSQIHNISSFNCNVAIEVLPASPEGFFAALNIEQGPAQTLERHRFEKEFNSNRDLMVGGLLRVDAPIKLNFVATGLPSDGVALPAGTLLRILATEVIDVPSVVTHQNTRTGNRTVQASLTRKTIRFFVAPANLYKGVGSAADLLESIVEAAYFDCGGVTEPYMSDCPNGKRITVFPQGTPIYKVPALRE